MSPSQQQNREGVLGRRLMDVYDRLYAHYGPLHWWPAETPLEVIVGAVLTQNTAWTNVEKALRNLQQLTPLERRALLAMPAWELAQAIRSSGFYTIKAARLRSVLEWLGEEWEERLRPRDLDGLRADLLRVHGIGEETADSILLCAMALPTFVIDAYTRRILCRLAIEPPPPVILSPTPVILSGAKNLEGGRWGYEAYRRLFMDNIPPEVPLYNEYHAQLVYLGKNHCRKHPRCTGCPLLDLCPSGQDAVPQATP